MNKVYNIVYNEHTGTWVAVSEHQPKRGKSGRIGLDGNGVSIAAVTTTVALAAAPVSVQAATYTFTGAEVGSGGKNIAIGVSGTKAMGNNSARGATAVGYHAVADGDIALSLGNNTNATGEAAISIGISNKAIGTHAHAIGNRNDVFVGRGVAVGLVNTINGTNSVSSNAFGETNTITSASHSNALGSYNKILNANYGTAVGSNNSVSAAVNGSAFGNRNTVNAENATAVGIGNTVHGKNSIALGVGNTVNNAAENSVVLGRGNTVSAVNATAIGYGATASAANSIALGSYAVAGNPATVTAFKNKDALNVSQDQKYAGNPNFAVLSVGSKNHERQIQHVAPGRVDAGSTDAVNGSQLYEVATKTGFNLRENGMERKNARINNDDFVNFANGTFTTANVSNNTVKINAVTQNITVNAKGVAAVEGDAGLTNATTVMNAINNSGFTLQANGKDGGLVKAGDTVNIQKGTNIEISKAGNTITINTSDSPTFTTVTAKKVTGLDDAKNDKDAVNFGQMNKAIAESKGSWQLGANNDALGTVNATNNIVRIIQGKNIKVERDANNITVKTDDNVTFSNVTVTNNLSTKNLTATGDTKLGNLTVNQGSTVNMGGNAITNIGESNDNKSAATVKQVNEVKNLVAGGTKYVGNIAIDNYDKVVSRKLGEQLEIVGGAAATQGDYSAKNTRTRSGNGKVEIQFADSPEFKNVTVAEKLKTNELTVTGNTVLEKDLTVKGNTNLKNTTIDGGLTMKNGDINMGGTNKITNLADATDGKDAVNLNVLNSIVKNSAWKLGINEESGNALVDVKANNEVRIQKGKNIEITRNVRDITVATSPTPEFDSVKTKDLTATGKTTLGGEVTLLPNTNINMGDNFIHGVKAGVDDNDAVNVAQMNALKDVLNKGTIYKGNQGDNVTRQLGEVLNVVGGLPENKRAQASTKNTLTKSSGDKIEILFSDNPEFNNVNVTDTLTTNNLNATGTTNLKNTTIDGGLTVKSGGINMNNTKISNLADATENGDAVNWKQVKEIKDTLTATTNKGTKYGGNVGNNVSLALGEKLDILGGAKAKGGYNGDNIRTRTDGDKIHIEFSDSPAFKNVTVSDTLTTKDLTVNGKTNLKGDTVIGGAGKTFTVNNGTTVNMDGNRITNVGTAKDKGDAVNYDLLNSTVSTAVANSAWKLGVNDKALVDVKAGNEVRVLQGRNIEVRRDGHNITVETVLNPVFENITAGSLNATTVNATNATIAQNLNVGGNTTLQATTVNGAFTANDKVFLNGDTTIGGAGKNLTVVEGTRIDMGNNIIHNVKAGTNNTDAVNLGQMRDELKALNTTLTGLGLKFKGDNETEEVLRPLGSTLTVRGDLDKNADASSKNIRTRGNKNKNEIEILMADNPVFGNVTTQDLTVNGNTNIGGAGKNFNVANGTTVNFGGNTVSNIGDAKNKTDATNLGQVESLIANTTANLTGLGMNYAGDVGDSFKRDLGSTVKISGKLSENADANSDNLRTRTDPQNGTVLVEFALNPVFGNVTTQDLTVNGNTNLKGDTTVGGAGKNFNVANGTTVNFSGNSITNIGDAKNAGDATNLGQVQNLIANSVNATTANLTNLGMKFKGDNDEVVLRPLGETLAVRGDGKNISTQSNKDTNEITVMMAENPVFGNVTTQDLTVNGDTNLKGNTTIGGADKTFNVAAGTKVDMGGNVITNIGAGDVSQNSKDAVNGSQLYQLTELVRSTESKLADGGMTFTGNSGSTPRKLGQTLEIVGAGSTAGSYSSANIRTQASEGKVEIQMADSPVLQNLQVNGSTTLNNAVVNGDLTANGNVTVGGQGKHFTVAEGTTVNLGGNSITNIQPGTVADGSSDVITGGQLYQVANRFGDGLGRLAARVDDVDKDLRGGVAGAVASSLLPQAMNPAERLVAVSAGTYRGASALAVGYSQVTDNGKYIVKFAGSVNNRKHVSAGVAVGYRF